MMNHQQIHITHIIPLQSMRIDTHQSHVVGASPPTLVADSLPGFKGLAGTRSFLWGDSLVNLPEKKDMHGTCMCVK